jgi:hypothetical protein
MILLALWWTTSIPALGDFVRRRHPRFSPHLLESGAIFQQMAQRPGAVTTGCLLAAAALAAHFLGYYFSSRAFGSPLQIGALFSIMPIVDFQRPAGCFFWHSIRDCDIDFLGRIWRSGYGGALRGFVSAICETSRT